MDTPRFLPFPALVFPAARCVCNRFALLLILLVAAVAPGAWAETTTPSPQAAATASELGLGPVSSYTLSNGMRVLVAPSQAADLVTLDVWMGAGTRRETAQTNGVAHFLEHLLFKGTPTRKPGEIDAAIEDLGGTLNAATSYDWAHFYVTVGSSDAPAALAVLSDALMHAELRQDDINSERPVILAEMARGQSSPAERLTEAFNALSFPNHPYGRPLLGSEANVTQMDRQTILDFYRTYYAPRNATLVITGNITPEAGRTMAQKAFGAWPDRPVPEDKTLPEEPQTQIRTRAPIVIPGSRGYLILGFHAPSVHDLPDAYVMDVLLTWLGQGANNQLQTVLKRKQKLVTSISANFLTQRDPGSITVTAEFAPGEVSNVRDGILAQVAALRQAPLSAADLAAARHGLLASYLFDAQTTSGRADALGFYNTIDSYTYDTEYLQRVMSVTAAQVQAVALKYLNPNAYTLVMLLPPDDPTLASSHEQSRAAETRGLAMRAVADANKE